MHQAGGVDGLEPFGQTGTDRQDGFDRQRAVRVDGGLERGAVDVVGGHPGPVGVGVGVDHLGGVETTDPARGGDLPLEALSEVQVGSKVAPDHLERDLAATAGTAQVDGSHPATSQAAEQSIGTDLARVGGRVQWFQECHWLNLPKHAG